MNITVGQLATISGVKRPTKAISANMQSVVIALSKYGAGAGLLQPHRLAHFISQLAHESGGFRYDREIWGNTAAQKRYDVGKKAKDLGNTPEADGDGKKYAGRGGIQLTGRGNVSRFHAWCKAEGMSPPDFVKNPDLINTDPWEGLSAIWYWDRGNPTGRSLNVYADENNSLQITKKINGGLTNYEDRIRFYVRTALVFLGRAPDDIKGFQAWAQSRGLLPADKPNKPQVDGDPGPLTLSALHRALASAGGNAATTKSAPVVEEVVVTKTKTETVEVEKEVPVVPKGATKRGFNWTVGLIGLLTTPITWFFDLDRQSQIALGTGVGVLFLLLLWRGEWIIQRTKKLLSEIGK